MSELRVATWNVLNRDRARRTPLLVETLARVDADVVLLQETEPAHARELADTLGYAWYVAAPTGDAPVESLPALLSRLPVANVEMIELPTDYRQRFYAVCAEIGTPAGPLTAVSTHLRHTARAGRMALDPAVRAWDDTAPGVQGDAAPGVRGDAAPGTAADDETDLATRASDPDPDSPAAIIAMRLAQLAVIRERLGRYLDAPLLFGGDLNFLPDGPEYRAVLDWGVRDAWRAGPRLGSGATILEHNPLIADGAGIYAEEFGRQAPGGEAPLDYTLDFQFASPFLRPGAAWVFGRPSPATRDQWASDHLGIAVDYHLDYDAPARA